MNYTLIGNILHKIDYFYAYAFFIMQISASVSPWLSLWRKTRNNCNL